MTISARAALTALVGSVFVLGCGGGGGSSSPPPSTVNPPAPPAPPPPPPPSPPAGFGTPAFAAITAGDRAVSVLFSDVVPAATSYSIYLATQPGITPQNYATLSGGMKIAATRSPHTVGTLTNNVAVYVVVTAVSGQFESNPTSMIQITPNPPIAPTRMGSGKLADSGVTWCGDSSSTQLACPVAEFPSQDAQHGRDARAQALTKVGGGEGGFDFTKLDAQGLPLAANAPEWNCVRDNFTELMWETKTRDGGLRHYMHGYTWYNPDSRRNNGVTGLDNGGKCSGSRCDTYHYVEAVNAVGLCGHSDWRLPTRSELLSIINYGRHAPATDPTFFPDVPATTAYSHTWTSSLYINYGVVIVEQNYGYVFGHNASDLGRIRLVRGEPSVTP